MVLGGLGGGGGTTPVGLPFPLQSITAAVITFEGMLPFGKNVNGGGGFFGACVIVNV
jgi:hypothetical protein